MYSPRQLGRRARQRSRERGEHRSHFLNGSHRPIGGFSNSSGNGVQRRCYRSQKFFARNRNLERLGCRSQKMDASEREQYRAAIHGDREAFEMIIRTHSRTLFAIAYGILQNREEAEDVVQDSLIKAWKMRWRVRDPEKLPAWLSMIARHRAHDVFRKRRSTPFTDETIETSEANPPEHRRPSVIGVHRDSPDTQVIPWCEITAGRHGSHPPGCRMLDRGSVRGVRIRRAITRNGVGLCD